MTSGRARRSCREIQEAFAAHIRDPEHAPAPEDVEDRRMAVYRELFFNNVRGFLANNFPVARRILGETRFDALVRAFFVRHRAHTPLFPELPREFLRFLETGRGAGDGDPPFLLELAHYEWVELALTLDTAELDDVAADETGDLLAGQPVKSPLAWRLSYRWPVQRLSPEFQPTEAPADPTHLIVYRARDDRVRFLALNAVSARLLELLELRRELTGREALAAVAGELGRPPATIEPAGARVLADLRARDILLGTRPAAPPPESRG